MEGKYGENTEQCLQCFFNLSIMVYRNKLIKKLSNLESLHIIELYIRSCIERKGFH